MRADRLIALVLLLQARGRLTAQDLAARLEVSVRTIYRDLDALSAAGVPVYAEPGPGGGAALPDGYRMDLPALNPQEARALFLGSADNGSGPLADLGIGAVLDSALRKLWAALPVAGRDEAEQARQRLLVDTSDWWQGPQRCPAPPPPRHLRTIEEAVWQDRRLRIVYLRRGGGETERVIDPYALVVKRGVWYLLGAVARQAGSAAEAIHAPSADAGNEIRGATPTTSLAEPRVFRVSRVRLAELLDEPSRRPEDFDLARIWSERCAEFLESRPRYPATLRVAPRAAPRLARPSVKGGAFRPQVGQPDAEGWVVMEADLETREIACDALLAYGPDVEVLAPAELRELVASRLRSAAALYAEANAERGGAMGRA